MHWHRSQELRNATRRVFAITDQTFTAHPTTVSAKNIFSTTNVLFLTIFYSSFNLSTNNSTFLAVFYHILSRLAVFACAFCKETYYFPINSWFSDYAVLYGDYFTNKKVLRYKI